MAGKHAIDDGRMPSNSCFFRPRCLINTHSAAFMQMANRKIVYHQTRKLLVELSRSCIAILHERKNSIQPARHCAFSLFIFALRERLLLPLGGWGWMFLLARRIFIDFYSAPVWLALSTSNKFAPMFTNCHIYNKQRYHFIKRAISPSSSFSALVLNRLLLGRLMLSNHDCVALVTPTPAIFPSHQFQQLKSTLSVHSSSRSLQLG